MKNMKKKGFTLVELLVVIAIIAILATVSIVGYTTFINKANLSNDQTTIEMINDNLTAVTVGKEIKTAGDALTYLREANIYGEKLQAYTKGHHYVFDLANKAFVLVDETGAIVYPKNVQNPDLWALYSNRESDKVAGIKQYVATESVYYESDANKVFDSTGYVVDLNGFSWSVNLTVANAVTVKNGYIVANVAGVTADASSKQLEALTAIAPADTKVENKIITDKGVFAALKNSTAEEVTFTNCVIGTSSVIVISNTSVDLVFENCVFTSAATSWAVQASNTGDLTVKNCTFNGARGINVTNGGNVVIENNTFMVEQHCIQLGGGNWDSVTIKNNNFISGLGIARIHATMMAIADHADDCDATGDIGATTTTKSLDTIKGITFEVSGNTFSANFNAQFYSDCACVDAYTAYFNTKIAK